MILLLPLCMIKYCNSYLSIIRIKFELKWPLMQNEDVMYAKKKQKTKGQHSSSCPSLALVRKTKKHTPSQVHVGPISIYLAISPEAPLVILSSHKTKQNDIK